MAITPERVHSVNQPKLTVSAKDASNQDRRTPGADMPLSQMRPWLFRLVGVAAMLLAWQLLASYTHEAIVASPQATLNALHKLIADGTLWQELQITMERLLKALGLGWLLGMSLGLLAGVEPVFRAVLEPVRWVAMTLPAIVVAVLGMLWFGMGSSQVIFLVTFIVTPIIYVNTLSGIDAIDKQLIEVGRIYRFSRMQMFTEIYLPGIGYSLIAGLTLAAGMGVRAVILAELLGAFEGVGHSFNQAWTFLKTPDLFAWMLANLLLMMVVEFGLLYPLRRYFTRWDKRTD